MHLKKLNIQGVVQGDLLYTDEDITRKNIDGKPHLTFTPNTITYAVPEGGELGKQIDRAKVGIIFHTTYNGETLADMTASGGADVSSFAKSNDVFFDNATYKDVSGSAKFTDDETKQFYNGIEKLETLLNAVPRNLSSVLGQNTDFIPMFQMYINAMVKQGELPSNVNQFLQGFKKVLRRQNATADVRTEGTEGLTVETGQDETDACVPCQGQETTTGHADFLQGSTDHESLCLKKMNQAQAIGSFQQTDGGLEVTEPEGFVAVDKSGSAVKLVDRLGFSRRNLTAISKFKK